MDVNDRNLVTTSGASEPQRSAVVGGSGVTTGSNVAGSLRSSASDREEAGVANQAPALLTPTGVDGSPLDPEMDPFGYCDQVEMAVRQFKTLSAKLSVFCTENRNVHLPVKGLATELSAACSKIGPVLGNLRKSIFKMDTDSRRKGSPLKPKRKQDRESQTEPTERPPPLQEQKATQTEEEKKEPRRKRAKLQKQKPQQQPQQQQQQQQPQQQQQQHQQQQQQQQKQQEGAAIVIDPGPTWAEVASRGKKNKKPQVTNKAKISILQRRAPRTAAVIIDRPPEGGSLAAVMAKITRTEGLKEMGAQIRNTRVTRSGGILLEVEERATATTLHEKIKEVVGNDARVRIPDPRTTVLILGVPEWAEMADVQLGLANAGTQVEASDIIMRQNKGDKGGAYVMLRIPCRDAALLAEGKALKICWTKCRIKLMERKAQKCYACGETGHFAGKCGNPLNPRKCFQCGKEGHLRKECQQTPKNSSSDAVTLH